MTKRPSPPPKRGRRLKRIVAVCSFCFGLALWSIPTLPFLQHWYGSMVRNRVEKRMRSDGVWPTNAVQTNLFDTVARQRGERVAALLTNQWRPWSLSATFEITTPGFAVPIILATNVTASSSAQSRSNGWEFFAELLAADEVHFATLHREIQRAPHDFGFDYSPNAWQFLEWSMRKDDGWEALLKHIEEHRNYLRAAALLAMRRGDIGGAVDSVEDLLAVNDLLKDQPTSMLQQSRARGVRLASGLSWVLLNELQPNETELARLATMWRDVKVVPEAVHAFEVDLKSFHSALDSIAKKAHPQPEEFFFGPRGTNGVSEFDKLAEELGREWAVTGWRFLYGHETVAAFAQQVAVLVPAARSIPKQHAATDWVAAKNRFRESFKKDSMYKKIREFPMTLFLMSTDTDYDALTRATEVETETALTQTAIALERWRRRHGTYPENLQQLVPAFLTKVPRDWQSGQTICYARNGESFSLYAVGWDGRDDGGSAELRPQLTSYRYAWSGKDTIWLRRASANEIAEWQMKRLAAKPGPRGRRLAMTNAVPPTTNGSHLR